MSKIEWTQKTWNPVTGCTKVSPGCRNCYAEKMHARLHAMKSKKYEKPFNIVTTHISELERPYHWRKPAMIFVNSMADLFHKDVPDNFIQEVFRVMRDNPRHTFQILTKRAMRLKHFEPEGGWPDNVWMGVSVESHDYIERVRYLSECGARVKFVSCEPLISPVDLKDYLLDLDWVIVGGESGPKSRVRQMDLAAARMLRDDCEMVGTPFFYKQSGTLHPCKGENHPKCGGKGCHYLDGELYQNYPSEEW